MSDVTTTRPVYESNETRQVEQDMATVIGEMWGCYLAKLPIAYHLDYAALRDKSVVAWLELKRRYRNLSDHRCVFLSMQKVLAASELARYSGKPCLFVIQCNDGIFYVDFLRENYPIEFRGRIDRKDWQDQEAVIAIPTSTFRCLGRQHEAAA